ncbi:MAG: class I SAM-dependent methyltransferase [bacterium]|nr:class I SAM-dependent methyltransferase [bacterium]
MKSKKFEQNYFEKVVYQAQPKLEKVKVLEGFYDLLSKRKSFKNILDLGCGDGEFLRICQEKGKKCFGADISEYALRKAKQKLKGEFSRLDLRKDRLPYSNDCFDVVTIFDLVEHLDNPSLVLYEAKRVLKKGGFLFLTTPNGGYWFADFFGHFVVNDPTHINIQVKDYWQEQLAQAGFSQSEIKGCFLFGFPPSWRLRQIFQTFKLPTNLNPVFCPVLGLTTTLFIFAKKG